MPPGRSSPRSRKDVKGVSADGSDSRHRISVKAFSLFGSDTVKRAG